MKNKDFRELCKKLGGEYDDETGKCTLPPMTREEFAKRVKSILGDIPDSLIEDAVRELSKKFDIILYIREKDKPLSNTT